MYSPRQRKCAKRRRKQRPPVYVRERKIPRRLHEKAADKAARTATRTSFEHERLEPSKRRDRRASTAYISPHTSEPTPGSSEKAIPTRQRHTREHDDCRAHKGRRDIPATNENGRRISLGTPVRKPGQHESDKHQRGEGTNNIGNKREGCLCHKTVAYARASAPNAVMPGVGRHCACKAVCPLQAAPLMRTLFDTHAPSPVIQWYAHDT